MPIGKNIRELRDKKNMTQELLAEKMDVSRQAVSKWESGESRPSTQNLIELAKIFSVSVDELISDFDIVCKQKINKKVIDWLKLVSAISLMLAFVPFAVAIIVHTFLPNSIPMHYNAVGEIDRYGSKNEMLILAGCLSLFVIAVTLALLFIKYDRKYKVYFMIGSIAMSITFGIMQIVFSVMAIDNAGIESLSRFETMQVMCISINILMMFCGIILPFVSQNHIFGLRMTSTLNSKENWTKTHKLAGITVVVASVSGAVFAALISGYFSLFSFLFLIVGVVIPIIYSIKLAKQD